MGYLATWTVIIPDDDIDPMEAAKKAAERISNPQHAAWRIANLETEELFVVEIFDGRVIAFQ
jgi:hypothetical protein